MKLRDLREKLRAGEAVLKPTSEPRTPPGLFKGEGACCPFRMSGGICGRESPLTDQDEVDIGVGIQTGNHVWTCPEHGDWSINNHDHQPMFRDHDTGLPGPSGELKVRKPALCSDCGGLGTVEEDDGHAGRYGGRIKDCKTCGGTGSVDLKPPTYPGTSTPPTFEDSKLKPKPAWMDIVHIEDELAKRGISPDDVVDISITKPFDGPEHVDLTVEGGSVLKLRPGVEVKIIPDAGVPKNTIAIIGHVTTGPPKSTAAVASAEALLRQLEKLRVKLSKLRKKLRGAASLPEHAPSTPPPAPNVPEVLPGQKKCKDCSGSGEDINSINGECASCGGNGWVPSNIEKLKSTVDALKKLAEDIDPLPRSGSSGSPMSKVWADKLLEHGGLADEPLKVSLHSAGGEEVWYNGYERATTKLVYKAGAGLVSEQFGFPTAKTRAAFPAKMLSVWSIAGELLFGVEIAEETPIEAGETPSFAEGAIKVSLS